MGLAELTQRFGKQTHLLLILDFQLSVQGPAFVRGVNGRMMLYFHRCEDREPAFSPYLMPVRAGLSWAAGKSIDAKEFGSMQEAIKATTPTSWGYRVHGDVRSFEDVPLAQAARVTEPVKAPHAPVTLPIKFEDALQAQAARAAEPLKAPYAPATLPFKAQAWATSPKAQAWATSPRVAAPAVVGPFVAMPSTNRWAACPKDTVSAAPMPVFFVATRGGC